MFSIYSNNSNNVLMSFLNAFGAVRILSAISRHSSTLDPSLNWTAMKQYEIPTYTMVS